MRQERMSRVATARALVLLGSGVQLAATAVICFLALVFGPVLHGSVLIAVVVLVAVTLLDIALANLLALRGTDTRRVLAGGCGVLLAGLVLGMGALVLLITVG